MKNKLLSVLILIIVLTVQLQNNKQIHRNHTLNSKHYQYNQLKSHLSTKRLRKKYSQTKLKISFIAPKGIKEYLKKSLSDLVVEPLDGLDKSDISMNRFIKGQNGLKLQLDTINEMQMINMEVDNIYDDKYFYIYDTQYQEDGQVLALLASTKKLVLSDPNNLSSKALLINKVQIIEPMLFGYTYLRFNYEEIGVNDERESLRNLESLFAYIPVKEKQKFSIKGEKRQQIYSLYSYQYCPDCQYIGFRDTTDLVERNNGPFLGISMLFMNSVDISRMKIHPKDISCDNVITSYCKFNIEIKQDHNPNHKVNIHTKFFIFEIDEDQSKWESDHQLIISYSFEVKVKLLKLNFWNYYFLNNNKFKNTEDRENLSKYQNTYYGYRTISDGFKLFIEGSGDGEIFDTPSTSDAAQVVNLRYKIITNSGLKQFDYDQSQKRLIIYDNFGLTNPRNADEQKYYPELYTTNDDITEAWFVPFMFPFIRFVFPVQSSYYNSFKSVVASLTNLNVKVTPPIGNLDYILFDNNNGVENRKDLIEQVGDDNARTIRQHLNWATLKKGITNARKENNMLKTILFDHGQCYKFNDKGENMRIMLRQTRVINGYDQSLEVQSDSLRSYHVYNSGFSIRYNLNDLPIEIWHHNKQDDTIRYCILKRQFTYTNVREMNCVYTIGESGLQQNLQIDADSKDNCFEEPILNKYKSQSTKQPMHRVVDCDYVLDLLDPSKQNTIDIVTNQQQYTLQKQGDGYIITDQDGVSRCFMINEFQKIQSDYVMDSKQNKRMNNKKISGFQKLYPSKTNQYQQNNVKQQSNLKLNKKHEIVSKQHSKLKRFRKVNKHKRK